MLSANHNKYVFSVDKNASKINIKNAVEQTFSVNVLKVNTTNIKPKAKRDRSRRNNWVIKVDLKSNCDLEGRR